MSLDTRRIAVVGHFTYFQNHFPEAWQRRANVLCVNVDEGDYSFLVRVANFRPEVTVFYRPELYAPRLLNAIRGKRIAFLSEPIAASNSEDSEQTLLRDLVYSKMAWGSYHQSFYYDDTKRAAIAARRWPIHEYRPLPIDTSVFRPSRRVRPIDLCFVGKPTSHRIQQLDFLRSRQLNFVWVAHGVSGAKLAELFRRSKIVLNIHADSAVSVEPRIHLAACCGATVLSENLGRELKLFGQEIIQYQGNLGDSDIEKALSQFQHGIFDPSDLEDLSFDRFVREL